MTDSYEMEGPLGKKGGALGMFQSRHFAISADRGLIMWENAKKNVEKATWSWKEISRVELDKHKSARRFIVHTSTPLLLEAPTADNCDKWRHALEKVMDNRARAASVSAPSSSAAAPLSSGDASLSGASVTPMVSNLQATVQAQLAQAKAKREEEERIRASGGIPLSSESKREAEEKEHKSIYDTSSPTSSAAYNNSNVDEAERVAAAKKEDERKRHNALASNLAARLKARKEGGSAAVGGSASVAPAMPTSLPPSLPRSGPTEDRSALQSGDNGSDGSSAAAINAYGTGLGGFSYGGGTGLPTSQQSSNNNQSYDSYGHPISPSPASPGPSRTLDFTGSAYNGVASHVGSPAAVSSPTSDYQNPNGSGSAADFSSAIPPSAANALLSSILTRLPARAEGNASQTPSSPSSTALVGGPVSPLGRSGSPPPSSSPNHHTLGGATLGRTSSFKKTPTKPAMIKRVSPTATGRAGRSGRGDAVHREISVAGYDPLNDPFYPGSEPSEHTMRIAEAQAALHATRQSQLTETERKLSAVEEKRLADLREAEGIRVKAKKDIEDKRAVVAARLEAEQEVEKSKFLEKQAARDERYRQQQELKRLRKEEAERRLEQGRHDRLRRLEAQEIARRDRVSVVWEPSPTPRIGSLRNMIVPSQPRLSGTQTGGGSVKKPRSQSMGNGRSSSMKGRSSSTSALSPPDRDRRATTGAGNIDDDSERHQDDGRRDDHDATDDDANNNGDDDLQSNAAIADELLGGNAAAALSALVDDNGDDTVSATGGAAAAPKKKKKKTGGKKSGKGRKKGSTKKKKKKVIDDNDNDDNDDDAGQQSIDDTTTTTNVVSSAPAAAAAALSSPPTSPLPSGIPKKKSAPKTKGASAKKETTPVVIKSRAARQSDITATSPAAASSVVSPSAERKTAEKKVVLQCDEVRLRRAMNELKDGLLHWMVLRLDDTNSVEVEDQGKQEGMLGVEAVKMRLEEAAIQYALINVQRDISGTARVVLLSWQGSLSAGARRDKALAVRSQLVAFATETLPIAAAVHYTSTTDITYQSVLKELPKRDASATAV